MSKILTVFLNCGANPNTNDYTGLTLLGYMAYYNNADAIIILDKHGANLNKVTHIDKEYFPFSGKETPLSIAAISNATQAVHILLKLGAQPNIKTSSKKSTPLEKAVHNNNAEIVKLLLMHNSDPNIVSTSSTEPLLKKAVENGSIEIVTLLLEYGAHAHYFINNNGDTLLDYAQHWLRHPNKDTIIEILIKAGATIGTNNFEKTIRKRINYIRSWFYK
jgi:ankyrin repeat protein